MKRKSTDMTDIALICDLEDYLDTLPQWSSARRVDTHKCATDGCERHGCMQLSVGDVSSDYCYECAGKISGWMAPK